MSKPQELAARAKVPVERARARFGAVDVVMRVFKRYSQDDGGSYAAALTYYFFFSIFPLLLFGGAVLGWVTAGNPELRETLIREGVKTVPFIRDALKPDGLALLRENAGAIAWTAAALALYSGSGGVVALEHALNKLHGAPTEPNFVAKRLRSLVWLAVLGTGGLLAIGANVVREFAERIFGAQGAGAFVAAGLAGLGGLAVNVGVFATAYRYLPAVRQRWSEVLPGAVVAGVGFMALNVAGSAYLARGGTARNDTFGTFATAATLLAASYLLAQLVLLAAEVNLVLKERRELRGSSLQDASEREVDGMQQPVDVPPSPNGRSGKSAGQLMKEVTEDLSTLMRKEIELAKQELGQSISAKVQGAAIFAIVGTLGFFALIFVLLALRDGLDSFMWTWVADLVTAVILLAVGVGAALFARKKLATPISTELTKQTIKEDVEWAKTLGRR